MDRKRILLYAALAIVLAILVYFQFRTWRGFDWATFWSQTGHVNKWHIFHAIALIYLAYGMRAIRWKIFLQPVRPKASSWRLVSPTIVGFTGLALLGRPGELIRPYLIARRYDLPFSSQLAVWTVERIFDVGAFTFLLVLAAFVATAPKRLSYYGSFREVALVFAALALGLVLLALAVSRSGEAIARWVERRFSHLAANLGHRIALRVREFHAGLNTIQGPMAFFQLSLVSVLMWCMIAVSYKEVTHSYESPSLEIPQTQVLLLMGSSMVGSMIQLPGVGGGSQLATIAMLEYVFDAPHELAASCGIMLWIVTFLAIVPVGLALAHRERLSLRKLSAASQHEEEAEALSPSP
ncbi:MAG TPA: lysylphosphatidylglycerol synthase transmembrane domain-containing protein [Terriglobales bacterium]|nr:lysylphosphatidylglycerol synthase transmembrane domain-containing protein [Terriglobales bacterium]